MTRSDTHEGWRAFFDGHAPFYMQNVFTRNTRAEVEFLVEELRLTTGARVLDVGCGTGRHAVPLARRGCRMVGIDISRGMLRQAQAAAQQASVAVDWVQADATLFATPDRFDAAYCLCEGAFGLIGAGEDPRMHDAAIALNLARCLRTGARVVLTALNGLRFLRPYRGEDIAAGTFEPETLAERVCMEWQAEGCPRKVIVYEHGHRPEGLGALFATAGFTVEHVGGGTAGDWGRRPLDPEEFEIMLIAERNGATP
jgi:SAM-dependent methyltransferase